MYDILPVKARSDVDRLLSELQDAQFKLEYEPTTTIEYVETLMLLDRIQERVSRPHRSVKRCSYNCE